MISTQTDPHDSSTPTTADAPLWPRPRTLAVRTKADPRTFGYPSARAITPPVDSDLAAEEPERWDGLS